jgi:DNA polymerase-3 subunit epsilon
VDYVKLDTARNLVYLNGNNGLKNMREIPLGSLNYVIIDFETTGLNAGDGDEIIEVGAVKVENGQILPMTFHSLINPERQVPKEATRVHGIGDSELKDAPKIAQIMPDFLSFMGSSIVVAQNARFDLTFLVKNLARLSISRFENPILDTMLLSRFLFSYESRHNLDAIMRRLKIQPDPNNRHRSVGDCLMTAKALVEMIRILEQRGLSSLKAVRNCMLKAGPIPVVQRENLSLF